MIQSWAQAVLSLPNLAFLVIDTTGVNRDADIIRVLVTDQTGIVTYARIVHPDRHPNAPNTLYTGISQKDIDETLPLPIFWDEIGEALKGRYVLAYGLDFVQERLNENAAHYGLPPIALAGDCLHITASRHFNVSAIKLVDVCRRIGHMLPDRPLAIARAQGQLALLKAMAEGVTSVPKRFDEEVDEGDLGPF
jgi:hypothetical protein